MAEFIDRFWTSPDGLRLYARDYGTDGGTSGEPVVCLHGLTRNCRDFEAVAPSIAKLGRRVIAMDVRGRGRSAYDPHPMNYTLPTYAGDAIGFLAVLEIERATFIGTSMGGLITLAVAAFKPDVVGAVALNDVGPEVAPEGVARILGYAGVSDAAKTWAEAVAHAKKTNRVAFPNYDERDWEVFTRRLFRETPAGFISDYDPEIMVPIRAPQNAPPPDLWPSFAGLAKDRPMLLVRGALSDVLAPSTALRMRTIAPHIAYCEVESVGHAPTLEESAAQVALKALLLQTPG